MIHIFIFAALARSEAVIVSCAPSCSSGLDCSLNGACGGDGRCVCDAGWTGPCCGQLNLQPIDFASTSGGYKHASTSTWGGNIFKNASTAEYHMWIAEMAPDDGGGSCGLTTWGRNSQITHVSAPSLLGPYVRREVAVPLWSHNPIVRQAPDGTLVLWHIGGGNAANQTPPFGFCGRNGTSPCGEQSFDKCGPASDPCAYSPPGWRCTPGACFGTGGNCGRTLAEPALPCNGTWADCVPAAAAACRATPGCAAYSLSDAWLGLNRAKLFAAGAVTTPNPVWASWTDATPAGVAAAAAAPGCALSIHVAESTAGPWRAFTNATITPCAGNNPGPWVHPNGTIFIVFTEVHMGLWRADRWQGPYTLVTSGACGGGEDPSLFINPRGEWHCLYHRSPFGNPNVAIGHSFSRDGFAWFVQNDPAANSTIAVANAPFSRVVHGKRERPHVYYEDGALRAFVSGVGLVPFCDPFSAAFDPAADCSATTQYALLDTNSPGGWTDKTYTSVQGAA
jgi:hypothetical protein